MARSRNIKPGFFMNDELGRMSPMARLLFAGLWCVADREGRLLDRPMRIKAEVLPYDDVDINSLLNDLQEAEFIIRYSVDGSNYIQIINFSKHQNPHKNEAESTIPPYVETAQEMHSTSTVQVQEKHTTNRADSLNLIPDSLNLIPLTPVPEKKEPDKSIFETYTNNPELLQTLHDFLKMRKVIKKEMTERAIKSLLNRLDKLAGTDQGKIAILEQSIISNWANIYELKDNKSTKSSGLFPHEKDLSGGR